MPTVLNYNRGLISNFAGSASLPANSIILLIEFGIFVNQASNFLEVSTSVGVLTDSESGALVTINVNMDSNPIGTTGTIFINPSNSVITYNIVLTDVSIGHHVIQILADSGGYSLNGLTTAQATVYG
ncbi:MULTISPECIES: hypothetical protein [unclassified Paenibacillus]|uniref:hypothetical protein n=1 Tax=unclassified Paenibacillus TaxID=185978 RepID=UPI0030F6207F